MNWSDYAVIGIILTFAIIGLANGFVFSVFKVASFFLSIYISIKFYPAAVDILAKTPLYGAVKASILKTLALKGQEAAAVSAGQPAGTAAEAVISGLELPSGFKDSLMRKVPDLKQAVDMNTVMNTVSDELAKIIMSIIGLVLLYVLVRIAITVIGHILKGVMKLPVLKQVDKLGGFILGIAEGVLTVYIVCAALVLFSSAPWSGQVFSAIDKSMFAGFFYDNNFIVNFMFPSA